MTTITIKHGVEHLHKNSYESYQELMEDLAELHGYKILWQMNESSLTLEQSNLLTQAKKELASSSNTFTPINQL